MNLKVSVYIDGSNLRLCGKNEGWVVDYNKLKPFLIKNRTLIGLNYYEGITNKTSIKRFTILKNLGYDLKLFLYKIYSHGSHEKSVDTQIVADSIYDAFTKDFDIAVFCSGDRDILPAIQYLLKLGKDIEVVAFYSCLSWALRETTHLGVKIINISKNRTTLEL